MIICQNCGTTNNEKITQICRTCGALLPVSKSSRSKKKKQKKLQTPNSVEKKEEVLELHDIPKENEPISGDLELQEIPTSSDEVVVLEETEVEQEEAKSDVLQEIPAPPYRGTTIESRIGAKPSVPVPASLPTNTISDAFSELKDSLQDQEKSQKTSVTPVESDESIKKRTRLEKDMTEVLSFLSKKISVKKLEIPEPKPAKKEEPIKEIPPSSMNEILNRLISLDLNIEASAIIKTDGTILASAISNRISESLFTTIGMNLSMIGTDIIHGLDAGTLKSISLRATKGVLDLAPIDKENPSVKGMFLIIFSHPKVKSGIISFAVNIVKKQLKEYFGLEK